jgi:exodeoxyribonuclease V alpha subunit
VSATTDVLGAFRAAGVLAASDVHIAAGLARLGAVDDPAVVLAAALAARAPRHGHVGVDLATVADTVLAEPAAEFGDDDTAAGLDRLAWPEPSEWTRAVEASPLVGATSGDETPLVHHGGLLYLHRYRVYEEVVQAQLTRRAIAPVHSIETASTAAATLLTGDGADRQLAAVESALRSGLTVLVGGPGTGKTTTVAALLATLIDTDPQAALRIALVAPTGKAAARLGEAFREAARRLPAALAERLTEVQASTIHRLLGTSWASRSRFHHDHHHPLQHDVVIVDECSMVSLPLMARLLDAVRPEARVVLVGDPGQLASVEAGTVLADIAGPVIHRPGWVSNSALHGRVAVLEHSRRFPDGSPLDRFARSVRAGNAGDALDVLSDSEGPNAQAGALTWIPVPGDHGDAIEAIRGLTMPSAVEVVDCALTGDATGALAALEGVRVLCAHRRGPYGVERWNQRVESWLAGAGRSTAGWYLGRPVLVTANDYRLGLYNGDLGVVVAGAERAVVAFPAADEAYLVAPARLDSVETVHAMTIHKSQGSEFDHVVVVLPPASSRLATRELLYTAVTRARRHVTVIGDRDAVTAAVERRIMRSSGLGRALWPDESVAAPLH